MICFCNQNVHDTHLQYICSDHLSLWHILADNHISLCAYRSNRFGHCKHCYMHQFFLIYHLK